MYTFTPTYIPDCLCVSHFSYLLRLPFVEFNLFLDDNFLFYYLLFSLSSNKDLLFTEFKFLHHRHS